MIFHTNNQFNFKSKKGDEKNQQENNLNDLNFRMNKFNNLDDRKKAFEFTMNKKVFNDICDKAKSALDNQSNSSNKEKYCYIVAILILKTLLFFLIEQFNSKGFEFPDF